ncbi:DUF2569 family protein [Pseudobacteriovorax antillogorgiicola]|uniref:DUF2569 family protein n=1 Tax=Pseudobacteriovorax antillogorgiicola TaxID=1513793 RepID=UPI00140548FA|nr:DUF2569 family protein [Pseudobacteriovorax antillogorgiicola]
MILCHFETFHYRANIILIYRQICLTLPWHIAHPHFIDHAEASRWAEEHGSVDKMDQKRKIWIKAHPFFLKLLEELYAPWQAKRAPNSSRNNRSSNLSTRYLGYNYEHPATCYQLGCGVALFKKRSIFPKFFIGWSIFSLAVVCGDIYYTSQVEDISEALGIKDFALMLWSPIYAVLCISYMLV